MYGLRSNKPFSNAFLKGSKFQMKLEENGEKFVETVNVDLTGNSVEIKVPKHQDRMEVDILNDFSMVRINLLVFLVSTSG